MPISRRAAAQLARYLVTGVTSVAAYLGLLFIAVGLGGHSVFASVAAYSLATVLNYLLNYHWSFGSRRPHLAATWRFAVVAGAGIAANAAFVATMLALTHIPVLAIGLIFAAGWPLVSFLALRLWVFR